LSPVYSSPKSGTTAAATAPARLAREFRGPTLWRTAPDGTTDVVTLRGDVLERYRVHEDGTATLLDSSDPLIGRRWGFTALAIGALFFVGGGLAAEAGHSRLVVLVVVGWLMWVAAIVVLGRGQDLDSRAHRAYGGKGEWHAPTDLRNWTPRTSAQLAEVEQIADEHAGTAYVRDVGARTVDVFAVRKGRVERYWVDESGRAEVAETSGPGAPYLIDRALKAVALLLWLGLLAVGLVVQERKGLLIALILAALAVVMLLGWRNDPETRLARRLKRGAGGEHWIEIRTREPDNDA
jgi:hypothetical protein